MDSQQSRRPSGGGIDWPAWLGLLAACYLIAVFLWRLLVRGEEYDRPLVLYMTIASDLGMLVGLAAFRRTIPIWLFWTGMVSGIGLFVIRFSSKHAWYTGHLRYWLP